MSEKRLLALLAMLLGLIAGVLILVGVFTVRGNPPITVEFILDRIAQFFVSLVILFGSLLIYRGKYTSGGLVNLVLGVAGLFLPGVGLLEAVLAILSGLLGFIAAQTAR